MALKINRTITKITRIVGWGLAIIILACFIKVFIWEKAYYKRESASPRSDSVAVITKLPELKNISTQPITSDEYASHQVEAKNPRYLKIERLHVDCIIAKGSVSNDGKLQYPDSIYATSWYSGSSKPGNNGVIVISGIESFKEQDGQFKGLDTLEAGDQISIISGDSVEFKYTVKTISMSSSKDAITVLPKAEQRIDGQETLSLIGISDGSESFVVVRAVLTERSK